MHPYRAINIFFCVSFAAAVTFLLAYFLCMVLPALLAYMVSVWVGFALFLWFLRLFNHEPY